MSKLAYTSQLILSILKSTTTMLGGAPWKLNAPTLVVPNSD